MSHEIEYYISPLGNFLYGFPQITESSTDGEPDVVNVYCRRDGPLFVGLVGNETYSEGKFKVQILPQGEIIVTKPKLLFRKCVWRWTRWRNRESGEPT